MKLLYLSIPIIFLFLIGCSSTYKATYFTSKEDFHNYFNESVQDRELKITMTDDSSIVTDNGAKIINDSMILNDM